VSRHPGQVSPIEVDAARPRLLQSGHHGGASTCRRRWDRAQSSWPGTSRSMPAFVFALVGHHEFGR
jgi:hypothetical protein